MFPEWANSTDHQLETLAERRSFQMLGQFGGCLQNHLFPALAEELGPLSNKQEQLIRTLALLDLEGFVLSSHGLVGRPPVDRVAIARAFVAKAVYNFPTTEALLDRLNND